MIAQSPPPSTTCRESTSVAETVSPISTSSSSSTLCSCEAWSPPTDNTENRCCLLVNPQAPRKRSVYDQHCDYNEAEVDTYDFHGGYRYDVRSHCDPYNCGSGPQRLPTVFEEDEEIINENDAEDSSNNDRTEGHYNFSSNLISYQYLSNEEGTYGCQTEAGRWNFLTSQQEASESNINGQNYVLPSGCKLIRPQPVRIVCPPTISPFFRSDERVDADDQKLSLTAFPSAVGHFDYQTDEEDDLLEVQSL